MGVEQLAQFEGSNLDDCQRAPWHPAHFLNICRTIALCDASVDVIRRRSTTVVVALFCYRERQPQQQQHLSIQQLIEQHE
jgi:hypothetical protein